MLQRTIPRGKIVTDCRNYSSPVSLHPFHFPLLSNEFHQYTISDTTFFLETQERITLFYSFLPLFILRRSWHFFCISLPCAKSFLKKFFGQMECPGHKEAPCGWEHGIKTRFSQMYAWKSFHRVKFAAHVPDLAMFHGDEYESESSVKQHYGICMLFAREPPSTFVWIIPEINCGARWLLLPVLSSRYDVYPRLLRRQHASGYTRGFHKHILASGLTFACFVLIFPICNDRHSGSTRKTNKSLHFPRFMFYYLYTIYGNVLASLPLYFVIQTLRHISLDKWGTLESLASRMSE